MDSKVNSYLDRLHHAANIRDIQIILDDIAHGFGYDFYLVASIPRPIEVPKDSLMLTSFKDEWVYRYISKGYIDHDPVIPHMISSERPFEWHDLKKKGKPLGRKARKIMEEARTIGEMQSGFCIPIYGPVGSQECVSFAGKVKVKLTDQERCSLHILGICTVARIKDLLELYKRTHPPALAKREIECLKWASSGKTSWETAEILGISVTTIDSYLNNAMKKLGATNRVQAVAEALRLKLIN